MSIEVLLLFVAFICLVVAAVLAYIPGKMWWGSLLCAGLSAWELTELIGHVH